MNPDRLIAVSGICVGLLGLVGWGMTSTILTSIQEAIRSLDHRVGAIEKTLMHHKV